MPSSFVKESEKSAAAESASRGSSEGDAEGAEVEPTGPAAKTQWRARLAMALLGLAVVSPIMEARDWDSFPISSFPMFSRGDRGHVRGLAHAVLVHRDGSRSAAPPSLVGTPEPMVATSIIANHIAKGTAPDLCSAIAERAAATHSEIAQIEIVVSIYDTHRYFASPPSRDPIAREVHATCPIKGQGLAQRRAG